MNRSSSRQTGASPASDAADPVALARTRARRRLIGAVILLGIGIIAFPLVFETQPRPVPVDIAIEIPRKDGAPPLQMPASAPLRETAAPAAPPPTPAPVAEPAPSPRAESPQEPPPTAARPEPAPKPAPPPAAARPAPETPKPATPTDAARARALLEGKAASAANGTRFVVQVGAFADAAAARETRLKVEKLGLKTYTQVAETASGNRIRVRLGPYASREEAERVLGRAKAAGIDGVVLTL